LKQDEPSSSAPDETKGGGAGCLSLLSLAGGVICLIAFISYVVDYADSDLGTHLIAFLVIGLPLLIIGLKLLKRAP
jgi:hypothetical protein